MGASVLMLKEYELRKQVNYQRKWCESTLKDFFWASRLPTSVPKRSLSFRCVSDAIRNAPIRPKKYAAEQNERPTLHKFPIRAFSFRRM